MNNKNMECITPGESAEININEANVLRTMCLIFHFNLIIHIFHCKMRHLCLVFSQLPYSHLLLVPLWLFYLGRCQWTQRFNWLAVCSHSTSVCVDVPLAASPLLSLEADGVRDSVPPSLLLLARSGCRITLWKIHTCRHTHQCIHSVCVPSDPAQRQTKKWNVECRIFETFICNQLPAHSSTRIYIFRLQIFPLYVYIVCQTISSQL